MDHPDRAFEQAGVRTTAQRLAIMRALADMSSHFEPEEFVAHVQASGVGASRATVYRTLPLLVALGLLREVHSQDRHRHYERTTDSEHHDHLICVKCGRTVEFVDPRIEALQDEICQAHGFHPVGHRTEIIGLCARCARV